MIWIGLAIGLVVGVGGYYAYDRYATRAEAVALGLGKALLAKAGGDVEAAWLHIATFGQTLLGKLGKQ